MTATTNQNQDQKKNKPKSKKKTDDGDDDSDEPELRSKKNKPKSKKKSDDGDDYSDNKPRSKQKNDDKPKPKQKTDDSDDDSDNKPRSKQKTDDVDNDKGDDDEDNDKGDDDDEQSLLSATCSVRVGLVIDVLKIVQFLKKRYEAEMTKSTEDCQSSYAEYFSSCALSVFLPVKLKAEEKYLIILETFLNQYLEKFNNDNKTDFTFFWQHQHQPNKSASREGSTITIYSESSCLSFEAYGHGNDPETSAEATTSIPLDFFKPTHTDAYKKLAEELELTESESNLVVSITYGGSSNR